MLSHKIPVKAHYCWIMPKNLKNSCRRNFIWSLVYFQCAWCWMKALRKFFHVLWVVSLPLCVLLLTVPTVRHIHILSGNLSNKMFHLSKSSVFSGLHLKSARFEVGVVGVWHRWMCQNTSFQAHRPHPRCGFSSFSWREKWLSTAC